MAKCYGIRSKNVEQEAALTVLLDPSIDLVVLEGVAGSGKSLMALAAGLEQVMEQKMYNSIIFTRAPVPVGNGLGFLPGTLEEKLRPWMGALVDNLEFLKLDEKDADRYISLISIEHIRGRSLLRKWLILDEVQNLSAQQLKVVITRAGEDTKIVCLGDLEQVDNPKLTNNTNALSYLIAKSNNVPFIKTVYLPKGERSRLATWGANVL